MGKRRYCLTALVGASLALGACTSDSTSLDDVAPQFEQEANEIFAELADTYTADESAVVISDDASTDIACDDGDARRAFEGTFPIREVGDLDETLDNVTAGIVVEFESNAREHPYELGGDYYDRDDRTFTASNDGETFNYELWTSIEPVPTLTMTGETICL
jgi:hypothetical protein